MRKDFCTILNLPFLLRGIALYRSLARVVPEFRLYVACMDEESESLLRKLRLPGLITVSEAELHAYDPPLAELRSRPVADYCKSIKPSLCAMLLERCDLITFLDADLMFFSDPAPMFEELGEASILLMPMRRGPRRREEKNEKFGRYNSGTVSFRRDDTSLEALSWWRSKILEGRSDQNPLLDQPFIKDWPERFAGVHVVEHLGCGVAPWNVFQYELGSRDGVPLVDGVPIVFYHYFGFTAFHSVNAFHRTGFLSEPPQFREGGLSLSWQRSTIDGAAPGEEELIWIPYVREVAGALADVRSLAPGFTGGLVHAGPPGIELGMDAPAQDEHTVAYPALRASARALHPVWRFPDTGDKAKIRVTAQGDLEVELRLPSSERFYLDHGVTGFADPPADPDTWAVEPETFYELRFDSEIEGEDASVSLFAIEYDDRARLGHQRISVENGLNIVRLLTSSRTQSLRVPIRFSGSGTVKLSPIILSEPITEDGGHRFGGAGPVAAARSAMGPKRTSVADGAREQNRVEAKAPPSPIRIALYGAIDMNLIDGSSVWLQSVAQVLAMVPDTEVTVLLRRPDERDVLTAPLRSDRRIELVEPTGSQTRLSASKAVDELERLDAEHPFHLVLLRGREVSEEACLGGHSRVASGSTTSLPTIGRPAATWTICERSPLGRSGSCARPRRFAPWWRRRSPTVPAS